MDFDTIRTIAVPRTRSEYPAWRPGDAPLGGTTWLFSEPQPHLDRLVDLTGLGWRPTAISSGGLHLAATCTLAELVALEVPAEWAAAPLLAACCRALVGSFKIWQAATVGGNLCLALPAGPMIALGGALEAQALIWMPEGGERRIAVERFVLGAGRTALRPGEILRSIDIPAEALMRRTAIRRGSLSPLGRSAALLIGTLAADGSLALTVTASTLRRRRPGPRGAFPASASTRPDGRSDRRSSGSGRRQ